MRLLDEPRDDWLVREQFRVVRVTSIPYSHNPSNCDHHEFFDHDAPWDGRAGRRFFENLTEDQLRSCTYHQLADWKLVAKRSVELFRAYRDRLVSELVDLLGEGAPLTALGLSASDRAHLFWLFADPIVWGGDAPTVVNGQHRTCAIRASGAAQCVIDHNRFSPYEQP
jgi:hypothetical protein